MGVRQPLWTKEETALLVTEYFRTKELDSEERKKSVLFISTVLRHRAVIKGMKIDDQFRNYDGVNFKSLSLKSIDPENPNRKSESYKNVSKMDRLVMEEYFVKRKEVIELSKNIVEEYLKNIDIAKEILEIS